MPVKELKPVRTRPDYIDEIEARIAEVLKKELYLPILLAMGMGKNVLKNARADLIDAIESGQIQYVNGHFEGRFNSSLSKALRGLGGVWDRKHGWWMVPSSKLSYDLRAAIDVSLAKFKKMADRVDRKLSDISPEGVAGKLKLDKVFDASIYKINKDFEESVSSITISPGLTEAERMKIAKEYTVDMRRYVQDFAKEEIILMREQIKKHALEGIRYENIVDLIKSRYGVGQSKAKFLARQESNLLLSKFKETRYLSVGVQEYRWKTVVGSKDHPVRPDHKVLEGKVFSWKRPPVTNQKTGARNNPGEDFGCRCVAIPIVRF